MYFAAFSLTKASYWLFLIVKSLILFLRLAQNLLQITTRLIDFYQREVLYLP